MRKWIKYAPVLITLLLMTCAAVFYMPTPAPLALSNPPLAATPSAATSNLQTVWLYNPAGIQGGGISVDEQLKSTMQDSKIDKPPLAAQSTARVEMILTDDAVGDANRLFYKRGWTDGLPIIPPTDEKLGAMLRATNLPPDQVVATLAPLNGQATVEKIAVNAIMAGCYPEYMPVLITAVEAIADPAFNLTGVSTTTNPDATMIIVNGPIAELLDINSGPNALGRGWEANARISRALHLIEQNIGGSWPGISDMSSLGTPGDFSMMMAENEAANPWDTLAVERGFKRDQNVVTVVSAEGMQRVLDIGVTGEGFLHRVANYVSGREGTKKQMLLILTPFTSQKLQTEGYNKESMRKYINAYARIPLSRYKADFTGEQPTGIVPDSIMATLNAADGTVQVPFVEQLTIVVAGGVGEKDELIPMWSAPVSREIKLPPNWNQLLQDAAKR